MQDSPPTSYVPANFMIRAFCLTDDQLTAGGAEPPLCRGGISPSLADSELISCEVVGEFLGLREVHRTTFTPLSGQSLAARTQYLAARIAWPGVIVSCELAPANVNDTAMADELSAEAQGTLLGDRNSREALHYSSLALRARLGEQGLQLRSPFKSCKRERRLWLRRLVQIGRRVETVIGQLVKRLHAKEVWARDWWHLASRWWRKVLVHTLGGTVSGEGFAAATLQRTGH